MLTVRMQDSAKCNVCQAHASEIIEGVHKLDRPRDVKAWMYRIWKEGQASQRRQWWTEQLRHRQQHQLPNGMLKIAKTHMDGASGTKKDAAGLACLKPKAVPSIAIGNIRL